MATFVQNDGIQVTTGDLQVDTGSFIDADGNVMKVPQGSYSSAILNFATLPIAADTVTIGADVYEFGNPGANIDVPITPLDVTATMNDFIDAINGAAAVENGTENVLAEAVGASVKITYADAPGGTKSAVGSGVSTMVLSEVLTAVADVWNQANLNACGRAAGKFAFGTVVIDATNLATAFTIDLPFDPAGCSWKAFAAANTEKATSATAVIGTNLLTVDADAGGTPLIATDYIVWHAWE
jgi:hypothetical protein